jgi:hypothetical protein
VISDHGRDDVPAEDVEAQALHEIGVSLTETPIKFPGNYAAHYLGEHSPITRLDTVERKYYRAAATIPTILNAQFRTGTVPLLQTSLSAGTQNFDNS